MAATLLTSHITRARVSLEGTSVGDALGERFFVHPDHVESLIASRATSRGPWSYTDDTPMALAVYEVLVAHHGIDRDALARRFAERYVARPDRGYGPAAHAVLQRLASGESWREAAGEVFGGRGSYGNGGAVRAAPVRAYFADDLPAVVAHAHAHAEGIAGAIAVALGAAFAAGARTTPSDDLLGFALRHTPSGDTRDGIATAAQLSFATGSQEAARTLGSGAAVSAQDTVPFALWCAARRLGDFEEALRTTVAGLGDRDTPVRCAIVGGIVALATGVEGIPVAWRETREGLDLRE